MSYCVNCGVELDDSAKVCALCSTPVINPNKVGANEAPPPYSDKIMLPKSVRRRFVAFLISMIILIPNIVIFLSGIFFKFDTPWTVYVNTSSALLWVVVVMPFIWKKPKSWAFLLIDTAAVIAYIYAFYFYQRGSGWFWQFAVPFVLLVALFAGILIEWLRRKKQEWPSIIIAVFAEIGLLSIFFEMLFRRYYNIFSTVSVSLIIAASCIAIIIFFANVRRNRRLRAWLSRKFFI